MSAPTTAPPLGGGPADDLAITPTTTPATTPSTTRPSLLSRLAPLSGAANPPVPIVAPVALRLGVAATLADGLPSMARNIGLYLNDENYRDWRRRIITNIISLGGSVDILETAPGADRADFDLRLGAVLEGLVSADRTSGMLEPDAPRSAYRLWTSLKHYEANKIENRAPSLVSAYNNFVHRGPVATDLKIFKGLITDLKETTQASLVSNALANHDAFSRHLNADYKIEAKISRGHRETIDELASRLEQLEAAAPPTPGPVVAYSAAAASPPQAMTNVDPINVLLAAFSAALTPAAGFAGRGRGGGRGGGGRNRQDPATNICGRCKEVGHFARDCMAPAPKVVIKVNNVSPAYSGLRTRDVALSVLTAAVENPSDLWEAWLADSGANTHLTGNVNLFTGPIREHRVAVQVAGDGYVHSTHIGNVELRLLSTNNKLIVLILKDVLLVPGVTRNLLAPALLIPRFTFSIWGKRSGQPHHDLCDNETKDVVRAWNHGGLGLFEPADGLNISPPPPAAFAAVSSPANTTAIEHEAASLHRKFNHTPIKKLAGMARDGLVDGLVPGAWTSVTLACETCDLVKIKRAPFDGSLPRATKPLERLSMDTFGATPSASIGGNRFAGHIVDDATGMHWVVLAKDRVGIASKVQHLINQLERQSGNRVAYFRTDNAPELISNDFTTWLGIKGITPEYTVPFSSSMNGVAERSIGEGTIRMLLSLVDSGLPTYLWGEALKHGINIKNSTSTRSRAGIDVTPHEAWSGTKPNLADLHAFGDWFAVYLPPDQRPRGKLSPAGEMMRYLGHDAASGGLRFWRPGTHTIRVARKNECRRQGREPTIQRQGADMDAHDADKIFAWLFEEAGLETTDPAASVADDELDLPPPSPPPPQPNIVLPLLVPLDDPPRAASPAREPIPDASSPLRITEPPVAAPAVAPRAEPAVRTSGRDRRPAPDRNNYTVPALDLYHETRASNFRAGATPHAQYGAGATGITGMPPFEEQDDDDSDPVAAPQAGGAGIGAAYALRASVFVPPLSAYGARAKSNPYELPTLREALRDRDGWFVAIKKELDGLDANGTWEDVDERSLPRGAKILGTKMVLTLKTSALDNSQTMKARLVVQGFRQRPGVDHDDTWSPTVNPTSIRVLLALANELDWDVSSLDVKQAFLQAGIDRELYIRLPPDLQREGRSTVARLRKSLYGLKQGAHLWYELLVATMLELGYTAADADPLLFSRWNGKDVVFMGFHVDDGLVTGTSPDLIRAARAEIRSRWDIKEHEVAEEFTGMRIRRDRPGGILTIDLAEYSRAALRLYGADSWTPRSVPTTMDHNDIQPPQNAAEEAEMEDFPTKAIIGMFQYLAEHTRPDLAAFAGFAGRHSARPSNSLKAYLKQGLHYLAGTVDMGLVFRRSGSPELGIMTYVDSDWASDRDGRRSTYGRISRLGDATLSWKSAKGKQVSASTMEAEYVALYHGTTESIWIQRLLKDLGLSRLGLALRVPLIFCDNQAAIRLAEHPTNFNASKHIETKFHFSREQLQQKAIRVDWLPTAEMVADTLTKALPRPAFERLRAQLGLGNVLAATSGGVSGKPGEVAPTRRSSAAAGLSRERRAADGTSAPPRWEC